MSFTPHMITHYCGFSCTLLFSSCKSYLKSNLEDCCSYVLHRFWRCGWRLWLL